MGYYYAKARFEQSGRRNYTAALLIPIIVHGLYDAPLFLVGVDWIGEMTWPVFLMIAGFIGLLRWMYVRTKAIVSTLQAEQDKVA